MEFSVLSSSSKANSVYVRSGETRVLFDCGLSAKKTVERLTSIDVDPESINAIVVSHEHGDHVRGIKAFVKKFGIPVFANRLTAKAAGLRTECFPGDCFIFDTSNEFIVGDLKIEPIPISHDAAEPVSFCIRDSSYGLGIVTDLGYVTDSVREALRGLDGLVLETNHDPDLLYEAPYPESIKQRIRGRLGHLSNCEAASLLFEISQRDLDRLQVVVAAHISEKSNYEELAIEALRSAWQSSSRSPNVLAASAYFPTDVLSLIEDEEKITVNA